MNRLQTIVFLAMLALLCACEKPVIQEEAENETVTEQTHGVYILNEGLMDMNNSTLSFYNFATSALSPDLFLHTNQRGLGDTGSDLKAYGSKLYAVVNVSETVEIMELHTARSLKQIVLSGKQPRKIAFADGFAYVCCFNGDVLQIDTATLSVTATARAGRNPDGICVANGKLYVSNSGGLDFPNYGNSVSIFQIPTLSLLKELTVELNPTKIQSDEQGDVYVVCNGNYGSIPAKFQRIDSQTDEVAETFPFPVTHFAICGQTAYLYYYDQNTQQSFFKVMNIFTETIEKENFITDGTTLTTPYTIGVNPTNGDVYISDVYHYTTNGDVFVFQADGRLKFKFEAGLNPAFFIFK